MQHLSNAGEGLADRPKYLGTAPFISVLVEDDLPFDPARSTYFEVGLWSSQVNECEDSGHAEECDLVSGVFYGTPDLREPKFCPRHFYERHTGSNAASRLMPTSIGASGAIATFVNPVDATT